MSIVSELNYWHEYIVIFKNTFKWWFLLLMDDIHPLYKGISFICLYLTRGEKWQRSFWETVHSSKETINCRMRFALQTPEW
jgi:hypothetical protein